MKPHQQLKLFIQIPDANSAFGAKSNKLSNIACTVANDCSQFGEVWHVKHNLAQHLASQKMHDAPGAFLTKLLATNQVDRILA
jgi:hypothetical protein